MEKAQLVYLEGEPEAAFFLRPEAPRKTAKRAAAVKRSPGESGARTRELARGLPGDAGRKIGSRTGGAG